MFLPQKGVTISICRALFLGFLQIYGCEAMRCGAKFENSKCSNNLCCSISGYCGETIDHCFTMCNPKYGRCDPFKVNASIGFAIVGNQCGSSNSFRYCAGSMCCSEYGYCDDVSDEHCGDGCQPYYGRCQAIAKCNLPSYNGHIFPEMQSQQRTSTSKKKNYWYFLCEPEHIVKNVTRRLQPVTCNQIDGTWPADYYPECVENAAFKAFEPDVITDVAFDGNLITCDEKPRKSQVKIQIDNAHALIQDVRITVRESGNYRFNVLIVDIIRQNNMTVRYTKLFDGIIKYGQTVVFFPQMKTPLMNKARRFIHLTPHVGIRICEIEVHSYNSGKWNEIMLIAVGMSSVIFFLLAALIVTVFCLRNQSRTRPVAAGSTNQTQIRNKYLSRISQSAPLPPSPDVAFLDSHSFDHDENHYEYEEIVTYTDVSQPQTNRMQTTESLYLESSYDEAISLGMLLDKPYLPPPPVPRFSTE
ncbi:hypothetical protein GHT06_010064 [Daphnia sinensis]|uniref:Chitin-binding type-1 domain-containing protein n=1 Tax=Daphnia sinensis TaxID=1820382 RepID=A0AAD5LIE4_9CRUS|nr:hypothetical protein GHT06_010064 [Daphnia sinensis]